MKKVIAILMVVAVALNVTATDQLRIEDFRIFPGETMEVVLFMDNEPSFTAFQTDLILPEGLSVVQEDEEYLFELSNRKASDHTIISKLRDDGAIRMVSFSIGVKPYSGHHGALVVIPITADEDFTAPATITLKHSICTTVDGVEYRLEGGNCEVNLLEQLIPGDVNGDGIVDVSDVTYLISYVLNGCTMPFFHTQNAQMNDDGVIDVSDVTGLISLILNHN